MPTNILKFTSLCNHPYLRKSLCPVAVVQRPITPMRQILYWLPSDEQNELRNYFDLI